MTIPTAELLFLQVQYIGAEPYLLPGIVEITVFASLLNRPKGVPNGQFRASTT